MMKNDELITAINEDFNYLAHYGLPGQEWYKNKAERYQNHAKYARGNPRYADKGKRYNVPDRMNGLHGNADKFGSYTTDDLNKNIPPQKLSELDHLDNTKNISSVRLNINGDRLNRKSPNHFGRNFNCPHCALAFEMIERGYDVSARQRQDGMNVGDLTKYFKGAKFKQAVSDDTDEVLQKEYEKYMKSKLLGKAVAYTKYAFRFDSEVKKAKEKLVDELKKQGNGARGIVVEGYQADLDPSVRTTAFHAFNYKIENGEPRFYDAWFGQRQFVLSNGAEIINDMIDPRELYYMRTDNVKVNNNITTAVYSKGKQ